MPTNSEGKPVMSQEDAQKVTELMRRATMNGIGVTAFMRDLLVAHGMTINEATAITQIFDDRIRHADFLFTLNGTTFDRGFVPNAR